MTSYCLAVPQSAWASIIGDMKASRRNREEVLAILFVSSHSLGQQRVRLVFRDYYVPSPHEYTTQTHSFLRLSQEKHIELLNRFVRTGYSVIHLHTHPGGAAPEFSPIDDEAESAYAKFLSEYRPRAHFLSGVLNEPMTLSSWRAWRSTDGAKPNSNVVLESSEFPRTRATSQLSRQEVFGDRFRDRLDGLRVALIGCGGLGAVVAEQLSRLGVRSWCLIDYDRVEESNLNRLPAATISDVGRFKTSYVASLIRRCHRGASQINEVRASIATRRGRNEAVRCDIIIVATDNHYSRLISQELSSRFCRPMISAASHIHAGIGDEPKYFGRVSMPPLRPKGWSLVPAEIIDSAIAAAEAAPDEIRDTMVAAGYLQGVAAPAVYWLNSMVASQVVRLVHMMQLEQDFSAGVDYIIDAARNVIHEVRHPDGECLFQTNYGDGLFGRGHL